MQRDPCNPCTVSRPQINLVTYLQTVGRNKLKLKLIRIRTTHAEEHHGHSSIRSARVQSASTADIEVVVITAVIMGKEATDTVGTGAAVVQMLLIVSV